jgi:hypothetical protein
MLGNGYCARPVGLDCHFGSICESCTFFHYAQAAIMSATVGWAMRKRRSGAVCAMRSAAAT